MPVRRLVLEEKKMKIQQRITRAKKDLLDAIAVEQMRQSRKNR